MYRIIIWSKS